MVENRKLTCPRLIGVTAPVILKTSGDAGDAGETR